MTDMLKVQFENENTEFNFQSSILNVDVTTCNTGSNIRSIDLKTLESNVLHVLVYLFTVFFWLKKDKKKRNQKVPEETLK